MPPAPRPDHRSSIYLRDTSRLTLIEDRIDAAVRPDRLASSLVDVPAIDRAALVALPPGAAGTSTRFRAATTPGLTRRSPGIPQPGTANLIVTVRGASTVSGTRFVRKEMISVLVR
ncbi:MAG: hypothetical protein HYU41_00900 [Candidatus Rokubacteria bacterium]|nr:hypothetical protein [Candidatus Rokubacteria bacterium]